VLARDFVDELTMMPSIAGLHIAAEARSASVKKISAIVRCAAECGVQVQELSRFSVDTQPRPGLFLGYGAIKTAEIREGLRRLRVCLTT
jgi:GntR family transcriptional regulator/MocR family aminotransferase